MAPLGRAAGLVWTVVTVMTMVLVPARPAGAAALANAKAQAAQLSAEIAADSARLDVLAQQYDNAEQQVQTLAVKLAALQHTIGQTRQQVDAAHQALHQAALDAYVQGSTSTGLGGIFSSGAEQASTVQEYRTVATGNLQDSLDRLHRAQAALSAQQNRLQATEHQAQAAAAAAAGARQQAETTQAAETAALSRVNGQIRAIIAAQQAAAAAAARQAFLAKLAAAATQAQQATFNTATAPQPLPAAGGAARAVQAAQSQLGVPYVWGGEQPGVGFDCSGLTQWAWRQAGVAIPRTAAAQYAATTHVPMSAIQPGDLLFWDEGGTIGHVAMYVGNGEVIQAPATGQTVSYHAIWTQGLVGAGRP